MSPVHDKPSIDDLSALHPLAPRERGLVEQVLRDQDSLWHALFPQSRDGVVILDQNGKVVEANQRHHGRGI